jgi:RNase H-fold protein (predicted Holliday junction resolvase)
VLPNDKDLIENILKIYEELNPNTIIIGESLDSTGNPNDMMKGVENFKKILEEKLSKEIMYEKEFMTSHHATVQKGKSALNARQSKFEKGQDLDASAAALILQRYLDRKNREILN